MGTGLTGALRPGLDGAVLVGTGFATTVWRRGDVVLKVLKDFNDRAEIERSYTLMRDLDIDHPQIPKVRGVCYGCRIDEVVAIQDYVPGLTLAQRLASEEKPEDQLIARWLRSGKRLCDVLWAAGIRRADLSAPNMIVQGDRVVLVDFHGCKSKGRPHPRRLWQMYGELLKEVMDRSE